MDNFKKARKLAKNFGSSTLNGALARAEEATAKADALSHAAIQARQNGEFKQAVDLFMTSASEYFIARDELVRASAVNGAQRKQWLELAGEMFMLSQDATEQANDLATAISSDRRIVATLPNTFESTWVMKGGSGSGRYPKGSGDENRSKYRYDRPIGAIGISISSPPIEAEYKGDKVVLYHFESEAQPLTLSPDGEVSVPDIEVMASVLDGDGFNSPMYAGVETTTEVSFSVQDEIGSIMDEIADHSLAQKEGIYSVVKESLIAGYKDFSLSPDGSPANTPKEIAPETLVYGTSPTGERQKICNVAQALSLATNPDISLRDPWVWEFGQNQFDNREAEESDEPDYDEIQRRRDDWRYAE